MVKKSDHSGREYIRKCSEDGLQRRLLGGLVGTIVMALLFRSFGWAATSEPEEAPKPDHPLFWAYGTAWGLAYRGGPVRFGARVWLTSLSIQTVLRIGAPPWRRPMRMLVADGTTHALYGLVVARVARQP